MIDTERLTATQLLTPDIEKRRRRDPKDLGARQEKILYALLFLNKEGTGWVNKTLKEASTAAYADNLDRRGNSAKAGNRRLAEMNQTIPVIADKLRDAESMTEEQRPKQIANFFAWLNMQNVYRGLPLETILQAMKRPTINFEDLHTPKVVNQVEKARGEITGFQVPTTPIAVSIAHPPELSDGKSETDPAVDNSFKQTLYLIAAAINWFNTDTQLLRVLGFYLADPQKEVIRRLVLTLKPFACEVPAKGAAGEAIRIRISELLADPPDKDSPLNFSEEAKCIFTLLRKVPTWKRDSLLREVLEFLG